MLSKLVFVVALTLMACAGPTPIKQPQAESWGLEFQAKPLSAKDVRQAISKKKKDLSACFQREKMSSDVLASYVFEFIVPNDGTPHEVNQLSTTLSKQEILSECLRSVLQKLHFSSHAGPRIRVQIPVDPQASGG